MLKLNMIMMLNWLMAMKRTEPTPAPMPDPITPSAPADKPIASVKTGDDAVVALTVSSLIISGGMYLFIRKES